MKNAVVAISDDLTGSLGLSILIRNEGLPVRALTAFDPEDAPQVQSGVLVINTESRACNGEEAVRRTREVLEYYGSDVALAKRFDTTLRGHLAAELDTLLAARPDAVAVVVPAYPSGKRTCVGGYQFLDGTPLERTEVAKDPGWPISHSYVPEYFRRSHEVGHVPIQRVSAGGDELLNALADAAEQTRIVVVDAFTDNDINTIAAAAARLPDTVIPVSPGVFVSAYLRTRYRESSGSFVLAVVGSVTDQTRDQIKQLEFRYRVAYLELPLDVIFAGKSRNYTRERVSAGEFNDCDVLVLRPEARREDGRREEIMNGLADAGSELCGSHKERMSGMILSGGETATRIMGALGATIIRPEHEFGSLIMGGVIENGPFRGLKVVTKGGLVGDQNVLVGTLVWFLKE